VADGAVGSEGVSEDAVAHDVPEGSLTVAIDSDGLAPEEVCDVAMGGGGGGGSHGGYDGGHGACVEDVYTFVVGYPEAVIGVFSKAFAGVAKSGWMWVTVGIGGWCGWCEEGSGEAVAVVAHGTTAVGGYPDEALTVDEDVVDVVVWQSCGEVEGGDVIALEERGLSPGGNARGEQGKVDQQTLVHVFGE
jgi:hypothetical protein